MLVKYLRDENRRPFGCVVALQDMDGDIRLGYSFCNPNDTFVKDFAVDIAACRAWKGPGKNAARVPDYAREQLVEEMNKLYDRAERYYKADALVS